MRRPLSLSVVTALLLGAPVVAAAGQITSNFPLSGAKEVPPVSTSGSGNAKLVVNSARTQITYTVTFSGLSGAVVAAHIHVGDPSVAGPVVLPLTAGPSPMTGTLTAADLTPAGGVNTFADAIDEYLAGNLYVNLHTAANPGGEIRGQIPALNAPATDTDPVPANRPGGSVGLAILLAIGLVSMFLTWGRLARTR